MGRYFSQILIAAIFLVSLAGCQERESKNNGKLIRPDLTLACTAKFLRSDGSPLWSARGWLTPDGLRYWYLTEQKHEIFIEPAAITQTTKEPFGEVILAVQNGQFSIRKSSKTGVFDEELFKFMTDEAICRSLLELYLAELKNPPTSPGQAGSFKFQGQVYDLVSRDQSGVEIYKNKSTQRNDLVITPGKKRYILYGYNYLKLEKDGHFPSKIDIYVYNEGADRKLVAQYDCRLL